MEDLLIIEYLRKKELSNIQEHTMSPTKNPYENNEILLEHKEETKEIISYVFTEEQARHIVSKMCHHSKNIKYTGEKYCMAKAKEVEDKYRSYINKAITCIDIYIAINSQYHGYSELFKVWFGDNIEHRIIESALVYWFIKDEHTDRFRLQDFYK